MQYDNDTKKHYRKKSTLQIFIKVYTQKIRLYKQR